MFLRIVSLGLLLDFAFSISQHPILIIVSYDAFRYDFFNTNLVPHMARLRQEGTYADYLINVFPTKTFPNHHSIATGLYPEVHGVIGNSYYDTAKHKEIHMSEEMFHYNEEIVPIWRRNEDEGDERYSGIMMWPGASFSYQGKNVTYSKAWEPDYDWDKRIDTVISWIKDATKPANLILLYIEEPDTHAHAFGPDSETVKDLLRKLDNLTYYLEQQLEVNHLSDRVNVVHLSDHGITGVKPPNFINVTQYLTPNTYVYTGTTPVLQFIPSPGFENDVYQKLRIAAGQNGHFKVFRKDEYLNRWHYKNNPRSPAILVLAEPEYGLDDLIIAAPKYAEKYKFKVTNDSVFGVHGYDYTELSMRPFFMARGPKIKNNQIVPAFDTVDLFNLFCKILDITPTENNGTTSNINGILKQGNGKYSLTSILVITASGIVIALILISCAAAITLLMIKRQQNITTTVALNKRFPQTFQSSIEAQHLLEPEDA